MNSTRIIALLLTFTVWKVAAVQITKLYVPRGASHEAPLDCKYDLEADQLYDVKWYKDGQQFFRCLPNGQIQEYHVEGVKVIHTGFATIGSCPLTLMMLNKKSAGEYKCEVSTEAPDFKTAVASGKLRIIETMRQTQNNTNEVRGSEKQASSARSTMILQLPFTLLSLVCALKCVIY